jgi:hypothetical protein
MLFCQAIQPDTLDTLKRLQAQTELADTRLVGGTALALQLGHRLSVDIDLFGIWDRALDLRDILGRCGPVMEEHHTDNIRVFNIADIKVDLVYYEYVWLRAPLEAEGVRMAAVADIAPMKLEAINNRGSKKDFIDLAFLLEQFSLEEILAWYRAKYPQGSEYMILRSLAYFDDAEEDPMPVMLKAMTWETVKERIQQAVRSYGLS